MLWSLNAGRRCERVNGVHSGGVYAGQDNHFYGHRKILKPDAQLAGIRHAASTACTTAEHYRNKIAISFALVPEEAWPIFPTPGGRYRRQGYPVLKRRVQGITQQHYWVRRALSFQSGTNQRTKCVTANG